MKKVGTILGLLLLATGLAGATTVGMDFTGVQGNNSGGVYTYAYYFTVTSGANTYTNVPLICDSYDNEVWVGETWSANEVTLGSLITSLKAGTTAQKTEATEYEYAAWYYSQILANPTAANANDYNWAIWGLFSQNAKNNSTYQQLTAGISNPTLIDLANFNYTGYVVYIPIPGTQVPTNDGTPQEYLGFSSPGNPNTPPGGPLPPPTPEPASLALLASGLLAVGAKFRK